MNKTCIAILALTGVASADVIFTPEEIITSREDITYEILQQASQKDIADTIREIEVAAAAIMQLADTSEELEEAKDFLEFLSWVAQEIKKDIKKGKPVWDTHYHMLRQVLQDHKNWFCE